MSTLSFTDCDIENIGLWHWFELHKAIDTLGIEKVDRTMDRSNWDPIVGKNWDSYRPNKKFSKGTSWYSVIESYPQECFI